MNEWIIEEMKHMQLKDKRLIGRLAMLIEGFEKNPTASIPEALCSSSETKAAYRFFDNDKVTPEDIYEGFRHATLDRICKEKEVLFLTDFTSFNFSSHKNTKGLGHLNSCKEQGLIMHSVLSLTTTGIPLGIFLQKIWGRDVSTYGISWKEPTRSIEKKESYCWIEALKQIEKTIPSSVHGIMVADRGADIYDLFAANEMPNVDLLVRAFHNRALKSHKRKLFYVLSRQRLSGHMNVQIGQAKKGTLRNACLEIRYTRVEPAPTNQSINKKSLCLTAIEAREINCSPNIENPVLWRLLTTIKIESFNDACRCVELYALRWTIERYHFVLKSGCKVEELQLESADRLKRALAVYSVVAWRLMHVTYQARKTPNASCEPILSRDQWRAIYCFVNKVKKPPSNPPNLKEAILLIAKLGGFMGRKGDGDPGVKVLWRGLRRVDDITETYLIFKG